MSEYEIKNLHEVLSGYIKKDQKIIEAHLENLTAPGENYGSVMLKLDITVKSEEDGKQEKLHLVAKQLPNNEVAKRVFNIQVVFKNEIAMYAIIVPTLQEFQRENGVSEIIDCFSKFYGGRINLGEDNGIVDENAVVILENLTLKGYIVIDRHVGFDLETTKLILKDLAAFHAVPLALKLRKPEVFNEKIRPYLVPFRPSARPHEAEHTAMLIEILEESRSCRPWIPRVKDIFKNVRAVLDASPREPFSTVTHGDLWVNNVMVKFQNGLPVHNKLVDFQVCDYRSPATDLFFFLFTSVQLSVLREDLDGLIEIYHKHFISHLEKLKCDITAFSFSKFSEELKAAASAEIPHTITMMCLVIFAKKGWPPKNVDPSKQPDFEKMKAEMSPVAKEKAQYMVQVCGEKGWL